MSDETTPRPKPGPTTAAMRLRPATQPGGRRRAAESNVPEIAEADRRRAALDELLDLHTPSPVTRLCRECITEHPCCTRQLAELVAGITPTPEEGSQ